MFNKKIVKRTPLRTSFVQSNQIPASTSRNSSGGSSLYAAISNKPVSVQEHNKVMIQNQRLAKENAYLKSQLTNYKESLRKVTNETVELKQQMNVANSHIKKLKSHLKEKKVPQNSLVSDQFKTAVNLLMEDYLAIDSIRRQLSEFGGRVETVKGIMNSLQSLIDSDNRLNESESLELSSDRLDSMWSSNSSLRLSLSSQEIDVKRRLSTERIRRDFQILTELSTIFEMSTEQRVSSLGATVNNGTSQKINEMPTKSGMSTGGTDNVSTSLDNSIKPKTKTKAKAKKETKPKNKTKPQKKIQTEMKANDSIASVYDFNEDEGNKENVLPLNVNPPQRHSKRIRSKRFSLSS